MLQFITVGVYKWDDNRWINYKRFGFNLSKAKWLRKKNSERGREERINPIAI